MTRLGTIEEGTLNMANLKELAGDSVVTLRAQEQSSLGVITAALRFATDSGAMNLLGISGSKTFAELAGSDCSNIDGVSRCSNANFPRENNHLREELDLDLPGSPVCLRWKVAHVFPFNFRCCSIRTSLLLK